MRNKSNFNIQWIFCVFAFSPVLAFIFISYLNISFYNFLSLYVWIAFILLLMAKSLNKSSLKFSVYLLYLFLFVIYTIFSDYFLVDKSIDIKYLYSNYLLSGFLAAFVAENITYNKSLMKCIIKFNIIVLIFAFFVIIYQQLIDVDFMANLKSKSVLSGLNTGEVAKNRLPSIYSWSSLLDLNFGFIGIATLLISSFIIEKKDLSKPYIFAVISLVFAFLTKARWIMINAFLIFIMIFIYNKVNIRKILYYFFIIFILLKGAVYMLDEIGVPVTKIIEDRILEKSSGGLENNSAGTRIYAFYVFAKLFPKNPFFGKGKFHAFEGKSKDLELVNALRGRSSQIHVGFLSLFYYYGLIGGILYILFLYKWIRKLLSESKESKYWGGFFVILGFILSNFTLVNLSIFYYGIILAIVFHNYYYQRVFYYNGINKYDIY